MKVKNVFIYTTIFHLFVLVKHDPFAELHAVKLDMETWHNAPSKEWYPKIVHTQCVW